jgi:hypothetical protein
MRGRRLHRLPSFPEEAEACNSTMSFLEGSADGRLVATWSSAVWPGKKGEVRALEAIVRALWQRFGPPPPGFRGEEVRHSQLAAGSAAALGFAT